MTNPRDPRFFLFQLMKKKVFEELFDIFDVITRKKIGKEKRGSIKILKFKRNCT
jgi:hypothetical protein